jgi:RNA polymerase-interacting CarD/CdnL/TRCF family regulator
MEGRNRPGLTVGTRVVYGSHGVGRVVAVQTAAGDRQEAVLLEFGDGLTVTLPLERASLSLRPLAARGDLARVEEVLQGDRAVDSQPWSRRLRAMQEKVAAGDILGWAEIVRDGIKGEQARGEKGGALAAPSERRLYLKARALLAAEVAAVREIDGSEADAWIVERVTQPPPG